MEIVKRHIGLKGELLGYTISDKGKLYRIDSDTAIKYAGYITNAILLSTGKFRARKGCCIDTEIIHHKIEKKKNTDLIKSISDVQNKNPVFDYYGRENIQACRIIRQKALEGNMVIDETKHRSNGGYNIQLFKLIKACGISIKDYIVSYLSVIQPYSLVRSSEWKNNNKSKTDIWIFDIGYKVKMYIKVGIKDKNKPIVISFHESNRLGEGKSEGGGKEFFDKPCAVFIDYIECTVLGENPSYSILFRVQRGFIRLELKASTKLLNKDVALIDYRYINDGLKGRLKSVITRILETYSDETEQADAYKIDSKLSGLSFMSYGYVPPNLISIMLDLYERYTDKTSRSQICGIVDNILAELRPERLEELQSGFKSRLKMKDNELLDMIINYRKEL